MHVCERVVGTRCVRSWGVVWGTPSLVGSTGVASWGVTAAAAQLQCCIGSGTLRNPTVLDGSGGPGLGPAPGATGIQSPAYAQILPPRRAYCSSLQKCIFSSWMCQYMRAGEEEVRLSWSSQALPHAAASQGVPGEAVSFSNRLHSWVLPGRTWPCSELLPASRELRPFRCAHAVMILPAVSFEVRQLLTLAVLKPCAGCSWDAWPWQHAPDILGYGFCKPQTTGQQCSFR